MGRNLPNAFASLRRRPLAERRILALAAYLALAAVIFAGWITSLGQTLPSLALPSPANPAPGTGTGPAAAAAAPPAAAPPAAQPAAPLQALREAVSGAIAQSKGIVAELRRLERAPATAPEPPPAAPGKSAAVPSAAGEPTAAGPAALAKTGQSHITTNEGGPARLLTGSLLPPPYSAYAASRLLSTPLDLPVRPAAAGTGRSRIGEVIAYNLNEIGRTAVDVYKYFTQ